MEWSYSQDRMMSSLERLNQPPKKNKWYQRYVCYIRKIY